MEQGLIAFLSQLEREGTRKDTLEIRMNDYLAAKARKKGIPIRGTFELTPVCNLNCKMCYVHLNEKQLHDFKRPILSGEQWKHIIGQAVDAGMMYALLTGGEAMLHPDFEDIYLYIQNRGVNLGLNTNGLLLTEKRMEFFKKHRPREIRVTVYGHNDDVYEKVTGRRVFSQVIEGIQRARESGIPIHVNITPNRYIGEQTAELVDMVHSWGVSYGVNSELSAPREETGRAEADHDLSLDEYIQIYKRINLAKGIELISVCEENLPEVGGSSVGNHKGFRCGGGRGSFAINWYGYMQPCLTFERIRVDTVRRTFAEAWKMVNTAVCEYPVPQECFGCPYERLCSVCAAQHESGAPIGQVNPAICQKVRRLVGEGILKLK